MLADGLLATVVAKIGHLEFAVGDRVVCTRNNKCLGIADGDPGTVVSAGNNGLVVTSTKVRSSYPTRTWPPATQDTATPSPSTKQQGATWDVALVWGENLGAESGYTALTRGRHRIVSS